MDIYLSISVSNEDGMKFVDIFNILTILGGIYNSSGLFVRARIMNDFCN